MSAIESLLLNYVVNAAWQAPVLCVAAWLLARGVRRLGPHLGSSVEHRIWCSALLAEAALPAFPLHPLALLWGLRGGGNGLVTVITGAGTAAAASVRLAPSLLMLAAAIYAALTIFLAARLVSNLWRTRQLQRSATPMRFEGAAAEIWQRLCERFHVPEACALGSAEVRGPVTVGIRRRVVIFPIDFVEQISPAGLEAAIAHECAHMRRYGFAKNLLYEVLRLPVAWHPAAWFTRAQVAESREIVCDAMAAEAMAGRQVYARALLQLASTMVERTPQPNLHAIGVFDANWLEERVMRLTEKRLEVQGARRLAMAALCVGVGIGTVAATAELRVNVAAPVGKASPVQTGAVDGAGSRKVSGAVMAGNIQSKTQPVYPQEAKDEKISGAVVLNAIIGKDGTISHLVVVSGPQELQASALDAVRQWVYKPYLLNGQPTEVETTITVNYSLAKQ